MAFPEGSKEVIEKCLREVRQKFYHNATLIAIWEEWASIWAPRTNSVVDYVQQLVSNKRGYHVPLKAVICDSRVCMSEAAWGAAKKLDVTHLNKDFEWPDCWTLPTNSVRTEFNLTPPDPRIYISDNTLYTERLPQMHTCTHAYYQRLSTLTIAHLRPMLERKVSCSFSNCKVTSPLPSKLYVYFPYTPFPPRG